MSDERPSQPTNPLAGLLYRAGDIVDRVRLPGWAGGKAKAADLTGEELNKAIRRAQVGVIRDVFGDTVRTAEADGTVSPQDDGDADFLYRAGHVLMTAGAIDRARNAVDEDNRFAGGLRIVSKPTDDVFLVALPPRIDRDDNVLETLDLLQRSGKVNRLTTSTGADERGAADLDATPDHLFGLATRGRLCPATEPETVVPDHGPWPPVRQPFVDDEQDRRVRVAVVDSGLWRQAVGSCESPWLEPDDIFADAADIEIVNPSNIHPYAGHGTFAAGVIACMAPGTRIEVEGALPRGGAIFESEVCRQLEQALTDPDRPQLINISAGTYSPRGTFALDRLARNHELATREDVLVIAAAGNDSSDHPFYPAASDWAIAVGSVDPDGAVSDFSNHGAWVHVYARGRNLVNAFPHGTYVCHEPPNIGEVRTFQGIAQWSGTSFSAPLVTGLIAARMRETGESPRVAWENVLAGATTSTDPRGGTILTVGPLN